jgi:MFS family permease
MHLSFSKSPFKRFNRNAWNFILARLIDGLVFSAWSLFFNIYILTRGFDKEFLGIANSLPSIATLVAGLFLGQISDRIGRRKAMLLGLAVFSFGSFFEVLFPIKAVILICAFCAGLGGTLYVISQAPFMAQVEDEQSRSLLFSASFATSTLAGFVGSLVSGFLPASFAAVLHSPVGGAMSYQALLICSTLTGALGLIPISLIREKKISTPRQNADPPSGVKNLLTNPVVRRLIIPNLLIGLGSGTLIPYLNLFFLEKFKIADNTLGILFSISSLLTGVGCLAGPYLARGIGKIKTIVTTELASLVFLLFVGFSPWFLLSAVCYLARSALMNMGSPLFSAFSMEQISVKERGAVNSLLNSSWMFGWAIGPFLSTLIQVKFGFSPLFISTAILYGTAAALQWRFFHTPEPDRKMPTPELRTN